MCGSYKECEMDQHPVPASPPELSSTSYTKVGPHHFTKSKCCLCSPWAFNSRPLEKQPILSAAVFRLLFLIYSSAFLAICRDDQTFRETTDLLEHQKLLYSFTAFITCHRHRHVAGHERVLHEKPTTRMYTHQLIIAASNSN